MGWINLDKAIGAFNEYRRDKKDKKKDKKKEYKLFCSNISNGLLDKKGGEKCIEEDSFCAGVSLTGVVGGEELGRRLVYIGKKFVSQYKGEHEAEIYKVISNLAAEHGPEKLNMITTGGFINEVKDRLSAELEKLEVSEPEDVTTHSM